MFVLFDPLLKTLCDAHPAPWIDFMCRTVGLPVGPSVLAVNPNVPSKAFDVDRAYRLSFPEDVVLHAEPARIDVM
mgnify:CR=1 FL=1